MSKLINVLVGYTPANCIFDRAEIIAEVPTIGEDQDGYVGKATIGVAIDNDGELCIFRGSQDSTLMDKHTAICMSGDLSKSELASEFEELAKLLRS